MEPKRWWGISGEGRRGYFVEGVETAVGRFGIAPAELEEMLPQQLLMLNVAAEALEDAGMGDLCEAVGDGGVYGDRVGFEYDEFSVSVGDD